MRVMPFPLPPLSRTGSGELRRLGIELELSGPTIDDISALVAGSVGGTLKRVSRYEHEIEGAFAGDWKVEFDFELLKQLGKDRESSDEEPAFVVDLAEELLRIGSETVVPLEVVTPPIPMDELDRVEEVIDGLRNAGALGTGSALRFAFGMHLNPEMPALDSATILRYLQAFLCLYDWLLVENRIDITRRLTPYIDAFPKKYVRQVIDGDYHPGLDDLIDDYLAANATRNRALDMLPLFAELDEDRVRSVIDDPRIKSRPTLHYRMPNCEIDEPDWGVGKAWRDWLQVEHLVADVERLDALCRRYAEVLDAPLAHLLESWREEVVTWLTTPDDR